MPHNWKAFWWLIVCKVATAPGDPYVTEPEIRLWYDRTVTPGLDALSRRIASWLKAHNVSSDLPVVHATLAALAMRIRSGASLTDALALLNSCARKSDVSHFAILMTNLPISWAKSLEWKGFSLGKLDLDKVDHLCRKAGDPLMDEVREHLEGCPAISSPRYECTVFDLALFLDGCSSEETGVSPGRLVHSWFQTIHQQHWHEMWADFEERRRANLCARLRIG